MRATTTTTKPLTDEQREMIDAIHRIKAVSPEAGDMVMTALRATADGAEDRARDAWARVDAILDAKRAALVGGAA